MECLHAGLDVLGDVHLADGEEVVDAHDRVDRHRQHVHLEEIFKNFEQVEGGVLQGALSPLHL